MLFRSILHFNQKRGYYQLRGDDEVKPVGKEEDYYALKVIKVEATDQKKNDNIWYNVHLENGWIYRRQSRVFLDWEGKVKEFIVTTDVDDAGNPKKDKEGPIKRSFRAPSPDDWTLIKKKTELDIDRSRKSIGTYIYDSLLADPNEKIKGKLICTIERKYYKQELYEILNCQKQFHPELQSESLYQQCIYMLYPRNVAHRENIRTKDFTWLFVDDVIFYQRPLKSKKSLIQNCPLEFYHFKDKKTGEITEKPIKCIARSNPYFQEFRLWQFIQNLRIYQREKEVDGKLKFDVDVTADFLPDADAVVRLFDWLNARKEIKQDTLLQSYFKIKKPKGSTVYPYRWNYVEDKLYPCNETGYQINAYLVKADTPREALTDLDYFNLWHLLYSVDDKAELKLALGQFAVVRHLPATFAEVFCDFPLFKKGYGSYSEKSIKKLLSLMRTGRYWQAEAIDQKRVLPHIEKLINGEADDSIQARVREQIQKQGLDCLTKFQGLPVWLAS